jgi:hypothetical protein
MFWRAAVFTLGLALPAHAEVEVRAMPGVSVREPRLEANAMTGDVCRNGFTAGRPRFVRLDRIGAGGAILESRWAELSFSPGYRGGCGTYAIPSISLRSGERVRLNILRRR